MLMSETQNRESSLKSPDCKKYCAHNCQTDFPFCLLPFFWMSKRSRLQEITNWYTQHERDIAWYKKNDYRIIRRKQTVVWKVSREITSNGNKEKIWRIFLILWKVNLICTAWTFNDLILSNHFKIHSPSITRSNQYLSTASVISCAILNWLNNNMLYIIFDQIITEFFNTLLRLTCMFVIL